jgi:hypothetical protein
MSKALSNISSTAAAADPQQSPAPTPEQLVEQLRAMRSTIPDVAPLTSAQRKTLRDRAKVSTEVLQAQVNTLGSSALIEEAVGLPSAGVRQTMDEATRWSAVEDEVKALLNGIAGANLIRRQKLAFVAGQAYRVAASLASDPGHAEVVPHVAEVRRLKRLARRKKASPQGDTPPPAGQQVSTIM